MALVSANQFQLTPDISGAVAKGLGAFQAVKAGQAREQRLGLQANQFALQQETAARNAAAQKQQLGIQQQKADQELFQQQAQGVFNAAVQINNLPTNEEKAAATEVRFQKLSSEGKDTTDTEALRNLYRAGKFKEADALLKSTVQTGVQTGFLKPDVSAQKQQVIDIRQQEADLRSSELEDRKLERQIKNETNVLKKEELEAKLEAGKLKKEQVKRETKFNAQSSIDAVSNSIGTIDRMLKGSGLESAAGFQANFPTIAGSEASDFEATLETLQSQAFLSQVEKMKGLGALSENEGKKLGAALGSLSIEQSDKALRRELGRVKKILGDAKSRMQSKFGISAAKTGALDTSEQAELEQLRAELGL